MKRVLTLLALSAALGVSPASATEPESVDALTASILKLQQSEKTKVSDDELFRRRAEAVFRQHRFQGPPVEVVYGADDRKDAYQVADPFQIQLGKAVCVVVAASSVVSNGDGTYRITSASRWTTQSGSPVCATEPFRGQLSIGNCTGFLVGSDIVATAGHCISAPNQAFIFDYDQNGPGLSGAPDEIDPQRIPADKVYFATALIDRVQAGDLDHAVVRVDRAVTGRSPVPIRRSGSVAVNDPMLVIGHGIVLPKKFDAGGVVKDVMGPQGFFRANLDTYGGNSGSPVFNLSTGVVEGILVRGSPDFVTSGGCTRSNVCPDATGCASSTIFEEVSKTVSFAASVPDLGLSVTPGGGTLSVGPAGGPFTNNSVTYTLANPTSSAINYSVSIVGGGTAPIQLNGGAGPITGSLNAGANTTITAALAASASGLSNGTYATTIDFVDTTNSRTTSRTHTLEIGSTGFDVTPATTLVGSGPVGGPFGGSVTYTVTSNRPTPVTVEVAASQGWLLVDGASSQTFTLTGVGATRQVTVTIGGTAGSLGAGIYPGSIAFTNLTGGSGNTTRSATLEVGRIIYAAGDTPKPLPDLSTVTSTMYIDDVFCIGDLDVAMNISHTFKGDMIVELTSPAGTTVRLHNRTGSSAANIVATYDQDNGAGTILPDGPGSLNSFDGQSTEGLWTLTVKDEASGDSGTLNSWSLRIATQGGCPPVATAQSITLPHTLTSSVSLFGTSFSGASPNFRVTALPTNGRLFDPAVGEITVVPHDVVGGGNEIRYRPNLGFVGTDACQIVASDGNGTSLPATIAMRIGAEEVIHDFPLNTNPGWTTTGLWAFGVPTGGGSSPFDPTSGFTGSNVYGYNLAGDYTNGINPAFFLTTTALNMTGIVSPRVEFQRRLSVETNQYDNATFGVSGNNGSSWTVLWSNPSVTLRESAWSLVSYPAPQMANAAQARLRWGMGTTDGSVTFPGWNIDDVRVLGVRAPVNPCAADMNGDGELDLIDFFEFLNRFDAGDAGSDVTGDGLVDLADFFEFLNLFDAGGC